MHSDKHVQRWHRVSTQCITVIRYSCFSCYAAVPTHCLVRFNMDSYIAVVPVKRVTKPGPEDLSVGKQCDVKWSTGKPLAAALLAIGKHHF